MPKPLALNPADCHGKCWHVPVDITHLQQHALIPLHAGELAKAAASMPLALVKQGAQWQLVAVCGLQPLHNLFIKNGQWLGSHQPVWLCSYPFNMVLVGDKAIATFDQDCGLLDPRGLGEPFFTQANQLTPAVSQRIESLKATLGLQVATQKAITALEQAGLITPWPEPLKDSTGMQIEGLHMVNEKAMAQLPDEAFLPLRKAQALPIAYAVNLSIHQAHLLQRLSRLQGAPTKEPPNSPKADINLEFLNNAGTISFGTLEGSQHAALDVKSG